MGVARLRNKGRSLLTFPDDYTVVDLETTGMSFASADIIEIACVKYRGNAECARYATLVQPTKRRRIPPFITALTGITTPMVVDSPRFSDVADDVWNFLEGELIVGHNVNFDVNFLYDAFEAFDGSLLRNDFVDTLRLARRTLPELSQRRLVDLCDFYHIETRHHRAVADCLATQKVLNCLKQTAAERQCDSPAQRRLFGEPDDWARWRD